MRTGRVERRLALADGVNVEGVLARRQPFDLKLDQDAGGRLHQVDVAHGLAAGILELGVGHFGGESAGIETARPAARRRRPFQQFQRYA